MSYDVASPVADMPCRLYFAAYLAMNENFVSPGEEVRTGQPVGIAGPTGVSISFFFLDKINSADWKPPDMSIHTLRRYSVLRKAM